MTTTLDWYGCATFRLRTAGLTIFLDAYIDRAPGAAGAGRSAADVTECDWIVVGHAHFDHLSGAEVIMANTDARLIGSYETIRVLEGAGVDPARMRCVSGGESVDLGAGVRVAVHPGLHSCVWSMTGSAAPDETCLGDLGLSLQEQQARMAALSARIPAALDPAAVEHLVASMGAHSPRGDGGALLYLFDLPDGTLLYQDTSGHWTGIVDDLHADVAIVGAAGRANVDGQPVQGSLADYVADHVARVAPRQVVLCHHDDWLPGFSTATDVAPLHAAIRARTPAVEILELGYVDATPLF